MFSWIKKLFKKPVPMPSVPTKTVTKKGMSRMGARSMTTRGLDVSHYQPTQNWRYHKDQGVEFMFAKCTEGMHDIDSKYIEHMAGAKFANILRGAYHFFHPSLDPIAQAHHFVKNAGEVELGYVIDWENTNGLIAKVNRESGKKFLDTVELLTGKIPIIYAGPFTLRDLYLDDSFTRYPLWIANYEVSLPFVPPPWSTWDFWQYSESGGLDKNFYNGSLHELKTKFGIPNTLP